MSTLRQIILRSTVVAAPIDRVWAILRDFNGHDQWHPQVAESRVENDEPSNLIGAVRRFWLHDGSMLREQLLALSDRDHSFSYCLLQAPLPLHGYVAHVMLKPVTDGDRTFWQWRSQFHAPAHQADELRGLVEEGIYEAGFTAIRRILEVGAARRPAQRPVPASNPSAATVFDREANGGDAVSAGAPMPARVVRAASVGPPEHLVVENTEVPAPGDGQIRLRQSAAGVNFIDIHVRRGEMGQADKPLALGVSGAGQVVDVGPDVVRPRPGDRIAYVSDAPGAYASVRVLDAADAILLPADIDEEWAAASLLRGMMAAILVKRVHMVGPADTVLVHSAAGGVGAIVAEWARSLGALVIGTVSTSAKREAALAHCDAVIVRGEDDVVARCRDLTAGEGVTVAFDGVGRETFQVTTAALAPRGHVVLYGRASGPVGMLDLDSLARGSWRLSRPSFQDFADTGDARQELADDYFEAVRRGGLKVDVGQRFDLEDAAAAHHALQAGTTVGATVLIIKP